MAGAGRAGEDAEVAVTVTAEAKPSGWETGQPLRIESCPRRDGSRSSSGIQLCEPASISSPTAVSSNRMGVAQDSQSIAIGPVDAQLGQPPTRRPGGIDKSPW